MLIEQIIEISTALLTPVIAVVATYIGWQQWKINSQKLNLDRYDRRLHVYEEVIKVLSIISRDGKVTAEDMLRFRTSVSEADFLFRPEIPKYIDEVYKRGLNLWRCNQEYKDFTQEKSVDYDHKKVVKEMNEELRWLVGQFEPAKEKFKKYLNISK